MRDDYSGSRSPGVTMGTCGTQVSYCPQITENLVGGQTYYIVVTSYRPNRTVSDGVNMYIYGEPVTFGNKSQSDAATGLSSSVQIELTTRARSLINLDKNFINGAINRHVSHQKIVRDDSNTVVYGSTNRHVIEDSIFANGDDTNLNGFFRKISPVAENKRLVINTAFSSIEECER